MKFHLSQINIRRPKIKLVKWIIAILPVVLLVGSIWYVARERQLQKHKGIASMYIKEMFEDGNIDLMIDSYLAPDIVTRFPTHFKMSLLGTNKIEGKESHRQAVKAWNDETNHKVEIVDIIAEGNKVAVLANIDRVFEIDEKEKVFEEHPFMFLFEFKDGKIVKTIMLFDVLGEVEEHKAKKYKF